MSYSKSDEERLALLMAQTSKDPLAFVRAVFPWGEKGELEHHTGPDAWQVKVLTEIRDGLKVKDQVIREAVAAGNGIGKAIGYETIIPTPAGEQRWGDLDVGDEVFGADGAPTKITACQHHQNVPMYRVTFDDGSSAEVSSGHLWNVRGRRERRYNLSTWRTLETVDLIAGVRYSNGSGEGTRQWEIPKQAPAQFEARETPLHPYLVGVWLGDGKKGSPSYTKEFPEVANKVRSFGYEVVDRADGNTKHIMGVHEYFKEGVFLLGSHERYIPDEYKYNCVSSRRSLLEGLLDTDGEVGKEGSVGYATTSYRLACDVIWLARSLGCKAKFQPAVKQGWYPDENGERVICRDCYRLTLSVPWNPFTLEHRKVRYRPAQERYLTRWIDSIEPIESEAAMCITVEAEDGLYLANDFIVTHNSALVAWLILWGMSTMADTRIVITANTENQLRTKTWPELSRWFRLFIANHWFRITATGLFTKDPQHDLDWRADAIPWSETNPDAFSGLHNHGKRMMVIMDEASSIADVIWERIEGAMTDISTEIVWCVFGNPTLNTGRFRECFDRLAHRWNTHQIDSRTVKMANKRQLAEWAEDYDEDDDWFRVHVRGLFPRFGSRQFISSEMVRDAASPARDPEFDVYAPLIMGVDVARFGENESVMRFRRGFDARSIPPTRVRKQDTMEVAAQVARLYEEHRPDAIFVDAGGVGGGVMDRLRMLRLPAIEVQFGSRMQGNRDMGSGRNNYYNQRTMMHGLLRDWLVHGAIDADKKLMDGLVAPMYSYRTVDGTDCILLEKKEDIKRRLGDVSLDDSDALALTFAYPVQKSDHTRIIASRGRESGHTADYQPLAAAWNLPTPGGQGGNQQSWLPGGISPWNVR